MASGLKDNAQDVITTRVREAGYEMRIESRWPVIATISMVVFLLSVLPGRIRIMPQWVMGVEAAALILPMLVISLSRPRVVWLRAERIMLALFFLITAFGLYLGLKTLLSAIAHPPADLSGTQLLTSSIAVWMINVLLFSIAYWYWDRGGPEARLKGSVATPDWDFPDKDALAEARPDWRPGFIDYLFLGFCTATAFSPTDALPLTPRAKCLMMLQSSISLITILVVAARAINIIGS